MSAIARGAAPGAWRRLGKRVLFAPVFMLVLVGCRTIDDDRHWGHHGRHWGHYHRHHDHHRDRRHTHPPHYKPLAPPVFPPRAKLPELPPQPAFRTPPERRHWHGEQRSGGDRDHGTRHRHDRGREHRRRGR